MRFDAGAQHVAAVTATNFGMRGPGALWVWEVGGSWRLRTRIDNSDGLYDVCWGPGSTLACASADGSLVVCGQSKSKLRAHSAEVSSVDWGPMGIISASYSGEVCASVPESAVVAMRWRRHRGQAYDARWAPRDPGVALSGGADASIMLWDVRAGHQPISVLSGAHDADILSVDWCPDSPLCFASASADQTVRVWDVRRLTKAEGQSDPTHVLRGHRRAVRRVRWAPWGRRLYSVGYDMALRSWDVDALCPVVGSCDAHSEFATGVDVCKSFVATCAWDQTVRLTPLGKTEHSIVGALGN